MIADCPNQFEMKIWNATIPLLVKGKRLQKWILSISFSHFEKSQLIRIGLISCGMTVGFFSGLLLFL